MRRQKKTDDDMTVMLKNKIAQLIVSANDVGSIVQLTNAFAKLRAVELKQDEGEWGQDLETPAQTAPNDLRLPQ